MQPFVIALVVLAALLLSPLGRLVIAALFGRSIGQAALASQPDVIHLQRCEAASLRNGEKVSALVSDYRKCGFEDAGLYTIPELKNTRVQLLANPKQSMYGAIYDHPAVGVWCDVVSRYADGSSWSFSTSRATGIKPLPNVHMNHLPGTSATGLIERARINRPAVGLKPASPASAVAEFERAYAEYIAALKQRGISTGEVVETAKRKVA